MSLCLQDDVIYSAHRIGKYTHKLELYIQCPPRRVKYTIMSEIENISGVRNFMKETPVSRIEIEDWGAASILRRFNDGVYIRTCSFISD